MLLGIVLTAVVAAPQNYTFEVPFNMTSEKSIVTVTIDKANWACGPQLFSMDEIHVACPDGTQAAWKTNALYQHDAFKWWTDQVQTAGNSMYGYPTCPSYTNWGSELKRHSFFELYQFHAFHFPKGGMDEQEHNQCNELSNSVGSISLQVATEWVNASFLQDDNKS